MIDQKLDDLVTSIITEYPVVLGVSVKYNNIYLQTIVIEKSHRRQGFGTAIMSKLCKFADENNLTITLTPSSDFGSNLNRLKRFYRSFGFKKNTDYFFSDSMMREPNNVK